MKIFTGFLLIALLAAQLSMSQTPIVVSVDLNKATMPVSPFIYGKNNVLPSTYLTGSNDEMTKAKEAGVRFVRQGGGNNSTKYNWRFRLSSHPDWYNNVYANDWDAAAKNMLEKMPGVQGMWSFQLLGKAAANTKNNFNDWAYNQSKRWEGVHQNLAGGGEPNPTGTKAKVEGNPDLYLMDWPPDSTVGILDHWFGENGLGYDPERIQYWDMDNEPEIWSGTHDDVMKTQISAEEFMQRFFAVAKAARAKYPNIKLVGPVPANEWQWYRWGSDGILSGGKKLCWLEYFIKRIGEEQKATGIKLLDVLDVHYYPGSSDPATCVQFHRVFFDRNYVYPEANGVHTVNGGWDSSISKEYIFGRCSDWLTKYIGTDHGVGLAVTESGMACNNPNVQAVWYASTMGEFMKNGVEIFTPWSWDTGMWETLHLFSRYNKNRYVQATSQNEILVSAYPTVNQTADSMTVVLVNRSLTEKKTVTLNFTGFLLQTRNYDMFSLSNLPATETFVSHAKNILLKRSANADYNQITVELDPLSVNSLILKSASVSNQSTRNASREVKLYPNPASTQVVAGFSLANEEIVSLQLLDLKGRIVRNIAAQKYSAGFQEITMNTAEIPSGVYLLKTICGGSVSTQKLILNQPKP